MLVPEAGFCFKGPTRALDRGAWTAIAVFVSDSVASSARPCCLAPPLTVADRPASPVDVDHFAGGR